MFAMLSRLALFEYLPPRPRNLAEVRRLAGQGLRAMGRFLRICFTDGVKALIDGRYNRRQAVVIMCSALPALMGLLATTVPSLLFPSPGNQAFYHFATSLEQDPASLIPMVLGAISTTLGFKVPLG